MGTQECTQIGENGLSESFRGICVHCCTRELCWVARAPQPPWCVGGAPSVAASPLVEKTGSARAPPPLGWRLRRGSNPHKPPRNHLSVIFGPLRPPRTSRVPRGPSGCPRRRRLTGPASTSARCIPGSVSAGQGCLPRLLASVRPDRSIMAQRQPSDCGYVTSSHVLRPSGRGVGGARARGLTPGRRPQPIRQPDLFRVSLI